MNITWLVLAIIAFVMCVWRFSEKDYGSSSTWFIGAVIALTQWR